MEMVPVGAAQVGARWRGMERIDLFGLGLIALAPVIFALLTWNTAGHAVGLKDLVANLSVPITAIELIVVFGALHTGFEPAQAIRAWPAWMRTALLALVAIAFGTALFAAIHTGLAVYRSTANLFHLAFGLAAAHLIGARWRPLTPLIWPAVVAGTCLYVVTVIAFVASIDDPATFDWTHFGLGVVNIRQTGFHSAVGAGAALGLAAFAATRRTYWLLVGAASLMTALSFWGGTRTSLVSLIVSFGAALLLMPQLRTRRALGAFLISLAAGGLLSLVHQAPSPSYGLLRLFTSVAAATADEVSSSRLMIWLGTLPVVAERPLFGYGESQFRYVVPAGMGLYNHPHNLILQVLVQWGLVGGACFFALFGTLWRRFHAAALRHGPTAAPALLVANAMLAFSLLEGSFYHPYPLMMTVLALAFVLNGGAERETPDFRLRVAPQDAPPVN